MTWRLVGATYHEMRVDPAGVRHGREAAILRASWSISTGDGNFAMRIGRCARRGEVTSEGRGASSGSNDEPQGLKPV